MLKRETKSMHLETPQLPSEIKPGEVFIHLLKYLSTPLQQLLEYLLEKTVRLCHFAQNDIISNIKTCEGLCWYFSRLTYNR